MREREAKEEKASSILSPYHHTAHTHTLLSLFLLLLLLAKELGDASLIRMGMLLRDLAQRRNSTEGPELEQPPRDEPDIRADLVGQVDGAVGFCPLRYRAGRRRRLAGGQGLLMSRLAWSGRHRRPGRSAICRAAVTGKGYLLLLLLLLLLLPLLELKASRFLESKLFGLRAEGASAAYCVQDIERVMRRGTPEQVLKVFDIHAIENVSFVRSPKGGAVARF